MDLEKLPGIFQRAVHDQWYFGLILDSGVRLAVSSIAGIEEDELGEAWLEVNLLEEIEKPSNLENHFHSPSSRKGCTVRLSSVQAIYELSAS